MIPENSSIPQRSGVLPVHKPVGPTSRRVIDEIEAKLQACKIGHGGTLDPLAEGVLPLMVNEATKLVPLFHEEAKTYRIRARFDLYSESLDLGEPTKQIEPVRKPPPRSRVRNCLKTFEGNIQQVPPKFSAIRSDGKRLYELNRGSREVVPEARQVHCEEISLLNYDYPGVSLEITCGKGFYVRSLVRDLANELDLNGGIVTSLLRTEYGPYPLEETALMHRPTGWTQHFRSPESAVRTFREVQCNRAEIRHLTNGGWIDRDRRTESVAMACDPKGRIHAILEATTERGTAQWRPKRVLNRNEAAVVQH